MLKFKRYITEVSSTINQRNLAKEIEKLKSFLDGSTRSKSEIGKFVKKLISPYDAYVNATTSNLVPKNEIYISALYDPDLDEDDEPSIEITLIFNPSDKKITMSSSAIDDTVINIVKAIAHEEIHRAQYRKRDYIDNRKYTKGENYDQKYYGNTDEIEAFSHNIATELLQYTKYDYDKARALLRNYKKTSALKLSNGNLISPDFHNYVKHFGINDPVIKRLIKRIYHFIDVLEVE